MQINLIVYTHTRDTTHIPRETFSFQFSVFSSAACPSAPSFGAAASSTAAPASTCRAPPAAGRRYPAQHTQRKPHHPHHAPPLVVDVRAQQRRALVGHVTQHAHLVARLRHFRPSHAVEHRNDLIIKNQKCFSTETRRNDTLLSCSMPQSALVRRVQCLQVICHRELVHARHVVQQDQSQALARPLALHQHRDMC